MALRPVPIDLDLARQLQASLERERIRLLRKDIGLSQTCSVKKGKLSWSARYGQFCSG